MFATGQGRKTDATDAHSVALVGTRMAGLRPVVTDEQLEVLRLLVDRSRSLGEEHTRKPPSCTSCSGDDYPHVRATRHSCAACDPPTARLTKRLRPRRTGV